VELVGRSSQGLGQQSPSARAQAQLAPTRSEGGAVHPDQVAQIERREGLERLVPEHVAPRVNLEPPRAVDEIEEGRTAVAAARRQPSRHSVGALRLLARLEVGVLLVDELDGRNALEGMREGVDAVGAQALELRAAVVHAREL
jgi:hypothetical protein